MYLNTYYHNYNVAIQISLDILFFQYPIPSYILYSAFLVVMPILVMNLLVGLAVDNIRTVLDNAAIKKLVMQTEVWLHTCFTAAREH